jgi:putative salt-induced outer membrane protein YdiY
MNSGRGKSFTGSGRGRCRGLSRTAPLLVPLLLFILGAATVLRAEADEVLLTNGDRITGVIKDLREGKLTLTPAYSKDPLIIDWALVKGLRTDTPLTVQLQDGSRINGPAELSEDGVVRIISTGAGPVVVADLSTVQAINPPAEITYKGDLTVGAGYATGNTNTVNGNLNGDFVARSQRQRLTLRAAWNYAEDTGTVSARNASGSIKYDFFPLKKLYTYVNTLLEYDSFQDLNLRTTLGGGLGYQFFETSRTNLSFELGASYVNEDFRMSLLDPTSDLDRAYAAGRWSVNFDYKILPDKIFLFHFHEGYFGFEDLANLLIRSKQGMRFTLLKGFFTSIQVNVDFNNEPANASIQKADTAILFGLGYAFDL